MKKTQQKEVFSMSTFRKATEVDIPAITAIYDHTHDLEERGETTIGWIRGVYPTEETAREALDADDLFVMEEDGAVVAAARINQAQVECYARANWSFDAAPEQVMVLHTLVVEPAQKGHGFGPQFVQFYEDYARAHGCPVLRIDTNARNQAARRLYARPPAIARPTSSTAISTPSAASTSSVWRKSWNGAYSTAKISGPRADAESRVWRFRSAIASAGATRTGVR